MKHSPRTIIFIAARRYGSEEVQKKIIHDLTGENEIAVFAIQYGRHVYPELSPKGLASVLKSKKKGKFLSVVRRYFDFDKFKDQPYIWI